MGTDAAADELKAMRLSKSWHLKNIRVCIRDGAHAAGRCADQCVVQHLIPSSDKSS